MHMSRWPGADVICIKQQQYYCSTGLEARHTHININGGKTKETRSVVEVEETVRNGNIWRLKLTLTSRALFELFEHS